MSNYYLWSYQLHYYYHRTLRRTLVLHMTNQHRVN